MSITNSSTLIRKVKSIKLKLKINITIFVVLIAVFSVLGFVIYQSLRSAINKELDERMISQLEDFYTILDDHVSLRQGNVNIALKLAHNTFHNYGKLIETNEIISVTSVNQMTKQEGTYEIPVWKLNGQAVYNSNELVDLIKENTIETATIFQKIDDGYLRISTNVRTIGGLRAINTFIPNSSEVIKTIERGEIYNGRAYVVNRWYLTAYEPIYINGEIKGILYVGIRERDDKFLKLVYSNKKYYDQGYPFLINKSGKIIYHPDKDIKTLAQTSFFKKLISANTTNLKIEHKWPENELGEIKYTYFKYFAPYESYICVSIYKEDVNKVIRQLLFIIAISVIISILLIFLALRLLLKPIINKIVESTNFAQAISKGDLSKTIKIDKNDEIGMLVEALQNMQKNLKATLTELKEKNEELTCSEEELKQYNEELQAENENTEKQKNLIEISEEKYRILFEKSNNALLILDNGKLTSFNSAAQTLFGYNEDQTLVGKSIWEISPEKQADGQISEVKIIEMIYKTCKIGFYKFEWTLKRKDNTILPTEIWLTQLPYENQQIIHTVVIDLTQQKDIEQKIINQKNKIEHIFKKTTDSINYAKRIQKALFPQQDLLYNNFTESFILLKPRDIVSGDFFWFEKFDTKVFIVIADCTGHGVPGAFMSLLGISILNEIIPRIKSKNAGEILNTMRDKVKSILKQTDNIDAQKDGMDLAFCIIDTETLTMDYAGANNPIYLVRTDANFDNYNVIKQNNSCLVEIKATRRPIAIHIKEKPFINHRINLQKNDLIYMFSDGFVDQFGGNNNRKFLAKNFKKLILEISNSPLHIQKELLEKRLQEWKQNTEQIDDILIAGIKI